jgi:hypothetical protein
MSREVPLTRGLVTLVDDEDYERVIALGKWKAHKPKHVWYAEICIGGRKNKRTIQMHRFIIDAPPGVDVDHRDVDGLNNRKYNLRTATRSQNLANRIRCVSQTGYRGVQPENKSTRFIAQITVNGRRIWLGNFSTAIEAARVYDRAAIEHFGEFARPNFPIIPHGISPATEEEE